VPSLASFTVLEVSAPIAVTDVSEDSASERAIACTLA